MKPNHLTASTHTFKRKYTLRQILILCLSSALYALLYALCSQVDQCGSVQASLAFYRFGYAFPIAWIVLHILFCHVMPKCCFDPDTRTPSKTKHTFLIFMLLFASYMPMFLIQYPGSFTYDVIQQAFQTASGEYNTFHPLLHTLLLRLCIGACNLLCSFERCAALCSIIQMLVMSWCFAMICSSLARSCSKKAAYIALLFFIFHPSHMAFASTYTKDAMFSSFFAVFVALCFEEIAMGRLSRIHRTVQLASGILACLLRNNMIYAMFVWFIILLFTQRRFTRTALCALSIIILAKCSGSALVLLTDAAEGPVKEMLSVPAQQFARVRLYAADRLTEQECTQMDALFDQVVYEQYDPTIADPIKNRIDDQSFLNDPVNAAKLWLSIGAKCPDVYLDAFLNLALPSLYPYSSYQVSAQYIEVGACNIGLTLPYGLPQLVQPRRFAKVRQWLNEQIYDTGADHHPIFRYLFNTGFIFWLLLFQLLYDLYAGNQNRVMLMLLPVMLWGTYLLGPVMQGRYIYPFVCILPLFFSRIRQYPQC